MTGRLCFERRRYLATKISGQDATAGENATRSAMFQAGNDAWYLGQPGFNPRKRRAEFRYRPQEALGIGVPRAPEQPCDGGFLHLAARVHHHDALRDLGHYAEVVGNE